MLSLEGKVVFITGFGSGGSEGWGNGQAIATLCARQGGQVFGLDRDREAAERTVSLIQRESGISVAHVCDVTDNDEVAAAVFACQAHFGRIDVLINNVGRSERGGPAELSPDQWREQIATNLDSAYYCCHHVLPLMEQVGGGAVVNVSSVAGLRYIGKDQVGYAAAKAALMQMTQTSAVIYANRGIRMNCVVPGLMHTPLVQRLADKYADGDYEGFVAQRNAQVPMGYMGDAWDVAHAALFLVSDEARYVTGQSLVVDGGLTCRTP
ncbi:MAG: SDR family NAD(P)-dependent oxidoreductase [Salinisphaera sp.]|jgi:NAD(P)-dependent dehydrogenase (short-subunit alcohol dehydrogenase family)|nr:SDR family NAD(P)-dependent oxidoreductase [Salinisphaera sp.]